MNIVRPLTSARAKSSGVCFDKRFMFGAWLLATSLLVRPALSATPNSLTTAAFSENFDGLGVGTALPSGWGISDTRNGVGGGLNNYTGSLTSADANATSLTGSSTGEIYIFNSGGDDAPGILNSGTFTSPQSLYFGFTNNTTGTITDLTLGWDYEKYRSGTRAWNWTFGSSADGTTFTSVPGGDQSYASDANNTTVTFPPTVINKTGITLSGLNIPVGSSYYFQWTLTGVGGSTNGQALAVDNFSLTATISGGGGGGNNYYWTANGTTLGGSGTWDAATTASWSASNTSIAAVLWDSSKIATFSGTAGTVTVSGTVNAAAGMSFTTDGYMLAPGLSGGVVVLTGADIATNSISVDPGVTATIGALLDGTAGMTKSGGGKLILTAPNTYSGDTNITGGTLQIGNGGTSGSVSGNITTSATLAFSRSGSVTFPGNISGTGTLVQAGPGTLILTGNVAPGGGATVSSGTLQVGDGTNIGSFSGNVTVASGASLVFNHSDQINFTSAIAGPGNITQAGTGLAIFSGALGSSTTPVSVTINPGSTFQLGDGFSNGTGTLFGPVTDNGALIYNRFGNITQSDTIFGGGTVEQKGQGILTITGAFNHTGGTTISAGTIQVGNGGTVGSLSGDVVNNGTLAFNRSDATTFGGVISGTGAVTKAGAGTLTLSGNNSYTGGTTISGGILKASHSNALGLPIGAVTVNNGSLFAASGTTIPNAIVINPSGTSGGLVAYWSFDNSTLNTVNTAMPGTFNTSGSPEVFNSTTSTLSIASAGANAATATVSLANLNGIMGTDWGVFSGATTNQVGSPGSTNNAFTLNGQGNEGKSIVFSLSTTGFHGLSASYATRWSSATGYTTQTWSYSTDGVNFTDVVPAATVSSTTFMTNTVDFSTIMGLDNQATVYLKLTFSGYSGAVGSTSNNRIDNVQFNATPTGGSLTPNSVLGSDITSGSATYSGNVTLNAPVALTAAAGGPVSFTGVFSDGTAMGSIFKTGDGTVNLAAISTYTGTTTLHQGTLALGVANAISTTSGVTFEGGTLATGGLPQNFTMGPTPANITLNASSTLDLGAASSATTVKFADSHAAAWNPGVVLSVNGWTRGTDHLLVGSDATGLLGSQLAEIKFADFAQGASISAVGELTPQIGDINQDTSVNVSDVAALETALTDKTAYQSQHFAAATNAVADMAFILDVNNDGFGNNLDLQAEINLLANTASGGGGISAVPEPASVLLLAFGGLITTARRVRAIASNSLTKPHCSTHLHALIS